MKGVEILYLAWNRKAFTETTFRLLLEHTDWALVDRLVVYDDGSSDGTRQWLAEQTAQVDRVPVVFRRTKLRSPVSVMNDYLERSDADVFVKLDNDIAVPDGWLAPALQVLRNDPGLDLLGLAAGWSGVAAFDGCDFSYLPCSHIGGVGAMRTAAFRRHPDLWGAGRQGLTQWQHRHASVTTGWLMPDLPFVQLDLIPEDPWAKLAAYYVVKGWAREWPPYDEANTVWWEWIPAPVSV